MAVYYDQRTIVDDILEQENEIINYDSIKEETITQFNQGTGYIVIPVSEYRRKQQNTQILSKSHIIDKINKICPYIKGFDFKSNKMMIAGGFIADMVCFSKDHYHFKDIDIFVFENDNTKFKEYVLHLVKHIQERADDKSTIELYETLRTYTLMIDNYKKIQIIRHGFKDLSDLFNMFDINCSQFAYDGQDIYTTTLGKYAMLNRAHILRTDRTSDSFKYRINKYYNKGFSLVVNHAMYSEPNNKNIGILTPTSPALIRTSDFLPRNSDTYDMNMESLEYFEPNNVRCITMGTPDYIVGYIRLCKPADISIFDKFVYRNMPSIRSPIIASCSIPYLKSLLSREEFIEYMTEKYDDKVDGKKWNDKLKENYKNIIDKLTSFKQREIDLNDKLIFGIKTDVNYKEWLFGKE